MRAEVDFAEIPGQESVRRAVEVAIAGGHHALIESPPGSGRRKLSRAILGIIPPPLNSDRSELAAIYEAAGFPGPDDGTAPVRMPSHQLTPSELLGDRRSLTPGEVSLAHGGALILQSLESLYRPALRDLREVLEAGRSTLSHARNGGRSFPAESMVIAFARPCPCGHLGDYSRECSCSPASVDQHRRRLKTLGSVGLRIEGLQVSKGEAPRLKGEPSECIRARIVEARSHQASRGCLNARLPGGSELLEICQPTDGAEHLLQKAHERFCLPIQLQETIWRVARTIADLQGAQEVGAACVAEAYCYRPYVWSEPHV